MYNEPGLTTIVAPGSSLLEAAAALIVAREPRVGLSDIIVLLPNLYAAPTLQRELHKAAGAVALLLPTITTLELWAKNTALSKSIVPESRRLALIHSALRKTRWFADMDLWRVAADILLLVNDCARHGVSLPQDIDDFQRVIRQALRASGNHAVQFEARLVHEIWRALQRVDANEVDGQGAHVMRLAALAQSAAKRLYAVGLIDLSQAEQDFLQRYAQQQAVCVVTSSDDVSAAKSRLFALLSSAWNTTAGTDSLLHRAEKFRRHDPSNPCAGRLRLFAARSLEHEAQAVAMTVRDWLIEGKASIAIIAQDRLTARRARALLERDDILIADESGWTLSTTTASSAVMGWLELVATDCQFRNLIDLIRSPFFFAAISSAQRQAMCSELESILVSANFIGGFATLGKVFVRARLSPPLREMIMPLLESANGFARKSRALANWLTLTLASLVRLKLIRSLSEDAAGADLLHLMRALESELKDDSEPYSFAEFRRWLDQQFESASFRDTAIDSSIVLTHLGLTDGRVFDGVIILGADADHLPTQTQSALFNEAVSNQLGLPSQLERQTLERRRLMQIIANSGVTFITWQGTKNDEANLPSRYWAQLRVFQRLAYDHDLIDHEFVHRIDDLAESTLVAQQIQTMPRPTAPALLPKRLSAYDYGSLVACPYQFFVRRMLGLREGDEVLEVLEKKDYGERVHRVLSQFHEQFPVVGNHENSELNTALQQISATVFADAPSGDYFARAWQLRWEELIPAYVDWQREREQEGWRWLSSETSQAQSMELKSGESVQLRGRLDRIDQRKTESGNIDLAVLDYKTRNNTALRSSVKNPDEDSQLPFYGLIADTIPAELAYVGVDATPVKSFAIAGDIVAIVAAHRQRLEQTLNSIAAGALLPAHGVDSVCGFCEAQGICRRRYWNAEIDV